ncbi:MAG: PQQ-binding-like beta-propeller repeat protein, partial [Elusimicrobiales bacterium]|nr:PQQ-binding-like beta-propeller repeat protein [Elusimicrobiales bacterium]
AAAADWPMFMGNAGRTGFTSEQAYPPLTEAWTFDVQGDVTGGPVVYQGVVYFGARSGSVYALDAFTGELLWDYSTDDWVDAAPAVSSGTVYAVGRDGWLYALDRLNGELRWRASLGAPSVSSPLPLNGRVYAGCGAPVRKIRAFDAATGALLWERQAAQPADSAPSGDAAGIYSGSNDGRIYALDPVTGADLWTSPGYYQTIGSFGARTVAVSSGSLYALPGHDERKLFRLSASDGSQAAVTAPFAEPVGVASENEVTAPVVSPYGVFAGAGSAPHTFYAFSKTSLEALAFSSPTAGNTVASGLLSSPAMANEVLYLGTVDARLIAVSSTGASLQAVDLSSTAYSSPAVSNGYVYVGVSGGKLGAYKAARIAALSAPLTGVVVDGIVPVRGYLKNAQLQGYALHYGEGEEPEAWTLISSASASSEISGGALGQWDVSGLANGLYTLRLSADETAPSGTLAQARAVVRVNHAPQPPSALTAADEPADSGNKVRLSWTASPSAGVLAYRVYRAPSGGSMNYLEQVSAPAVTYLDSSALTGTAFTYEITAYDGYSESAPSGAASATAVDNDPSADGIAPSAVTGAAAVPGAAPGSVLLTWNGSGNDGTVGSASGYEIRLSTYPSFGWAAGAVWKSSRAATGPYGTAEAETVTYLAGGVTYYFLLKAYDGNSNYSAAASTVSACAPRDLYPPAAPAELAVSDKPGDHGGALVLAWTRSADDGAGAADVYGYRIFRSQEAGGTATAIQYSSVPAGTLTYTDAQAPENIKYYYSVAAFDSTNDSAPSPEVPGISADNWRFFDASNGGTVRLGDGAEVNISGNAASQNDNILMVRRESADYFGPAARTKADAGGARATGIIYEVKFENPATKLLKPVTLYLPYTAAELGAVPEASLRVYLLEGSRWTLVNTSKVLPEIRKVSAEVTHFSVYSLMGYVPSGALLASNSVYTYPNPAKGDTLTFKFLPADTSDVTVDVYNVAGEKVARLEKAACPGGVTSELVWQIKNVASGVYVYRVEARAASGTKAVTKKLAIVH